MNFEFLSAALFFVILLEIKAQTDCVTRVKQGQLRGSLSMAKKEYCAFMGIPFAEPPIGHLRFTAPRPPKPWRGMLDATREAEPCIQPMKTLVDPMGSEDCLYLNVYTPNVHASGKSRLAVYVWISPGEFYFENSYRIRNRPDLFLNRDVIVVSFNYRVGALGFLSTEDDESPGNYGMKDQIAALRWIRENIDAFGGDPNKVTIGGVSSGAASVHYLMLSPLAKGLFQKAICQEGTAAMPWARNRHPRELARKQARLVGCPEEPSSALVSCLRNTSTDDITLSVHKLFVFWLTPSPGFTPVVEKMTERNPEPFITEDPITLLVNGKFHRVPFLIGGNSQPTALLFSALLNIRIIRQQASLLNKKLLPQMLMLQKSVPLDDVTDVLNTIKDYFNITSDYYEDNALNWNNLFSDRYVIHGYHRTLLFHALAGHHPIYTYHLAYRGKFSTSMGASLKNYGVSHADDLTYFFAPDIYRFGNDKEVRDLLMTLWTNFMKFGNPTPPNIDSTEGSYLMENLTWEPVGKLSFENMHIRYLNIGQLTTSRPNIYINQNLGPVKINMAFDLFKDRMRFWDSLPLVENVMPTLQQLKQSQGFESRSSCLQVSVVVIMACLCLWNSVYYTTLSF